MKLMRKDFFSHLKKLEYRKDLALKLEQKKIVSLIKQIDFRNV